MSAPLGTRTVTAEAAPSDDRSPVAVCEATLTRALEGVRADRKRIQREMRENLAQDAKLSAALSGLGVESD